jgi:hypothetical protein
LVSQLQVGQNIGQQYNNELGGRVKAAKPKTYNGSIGSDPDVWLFLFNQYSDIAGVPINTRAKLAATYLESKAATWWRNLVNCMTKHFMLLEMEVVIETKLNSRIIALNPKVDNSHQCRD